ncbi:MAG: peptidyl-prolyl cis-trans isomerase [Phycisphaeraceae bacterium]|nr:peptidyl-prolyl cis-trans isomerase [Phycisphaeraceae bacterium]
MDQNVRRELARRGYTLTEEDLNRERRRMSQVLSDDDDEATRLFAELRQRRRLGPARLKVLLRTNAGLRKLVQSEVQISPAMIEREYELAYGRLYEARVLTVPTLAQARQVMQAIEEGRSFTDLVVEMSTDPSRAQGGLLSPINLADAGYPQVVRTELARLEPGRISAPIAVDQSFVLLRLERIIEQDQPPLETVEEALVRQARLRIESRLMRELARTLLSQSDPTIFDPVLRESWNRQRAELLGP